MPRFRIEIYRSIYEIWEVEAPSKERARQWAECPPYDDVRVITSTDDGVEIQISVEELGDA